MDATVATGAAAMMAIRVLLDHEVKEEDIILVSLLMAESGDYQRYLRVNQPKNHSILNISSYSNLNLFWDGKILRTRGIMTLFNLWIPKFERLF